MKSVSHTLNLNNFDNLYIYINFLWIGDPEKLVSVDTREESSPLSSWKTSKCLTPLNLLYDVTPPDFVTAVITELGFLPCTSVPVVLRIRPAEPT